MTGEKDWDDLRRLARTLENTLDTKLVAFSRLGSRQARDVKPSSDSNNIKKEDSLFETMSTDIEQILDRLSEVNDKMWNQLHPDNSKDKISSSIAGNIPSLKHSSANDHTMQRHREILMDYQREYRRTRDNIIVLREREKLLKTTENSYIKGDLKAQDSDENVSRSATRLLLEESNHLHSSERLIDQQIGVASAIRNALANQQTTLKLAKNRVLVSIGQRLPIIGSLVQKINLRKRRDSIILGSLIGLCVCVLIFFTFR